MEEAKNTAEGGDTETMYLPLDEPRVIALKDGKFTYTFTFARITQQDWIKHFESYRFSTREEGGGRVRIVDMDTAGVELVQQTVQKVEGYAGNFMNVDRWREKILPRHAIALGWMLRAVSRSEGESDSPIDPERVEIGLDAVWSQTKPGDQTTAYRGLKHWFAAPTVEQQKRVLRAGASSTVIGGSKNPTTVYALKHRVLLALYDELILGVDGYSVGGHPLGTDRDAIKREMDGYHKLEAVQQLFSGGGQSQEQEAVAAEAA